MSGRRVLVTGADGFVGRHLCRVLLERGRRVTAAVRRPGGTLPAGVEPRVVGAIEDRPDWSRALSDVDRVVHLAGRAHRVDRRGPGEAERFRRVNVDGTVRLAEAAARSGVERFLFVSTVKVHGEATNGRPLVEEDAPRPADPYAAGKLDAERELERIGGRSMETVILRPPLVYGEGVGANFLRLLRAVDRGLPLPLAAVDNRRSLLYVLNLADALATALDHPAASGRAYLLSDGEDVSTAELVRALAGALGRPSRLVPVPQAWLRAAGRCLGREGAVRRLTGSLAVDASRIRRELGWRPPYRLPEGLARTAAWYRARGAAAR